jgi:hypothetical protein
MVEATGATETTPRLNLREAELRLLSFPTNGGPKSMELRRAFETPADVAAEDVFVEYKLYLEEKTGKREDLAHQMATKCVNRIAQKYSAPDSHQARLILKLYVCDIHAGRREDRIYAAETGIGFVKLTLAWILTLPDGSVVLDGGRMFDYSSHMYGLGDLLRIQDAERTLLKMSTRMSDEIMRITSIKSRTSFLCGMG